MAEHEAEVGTDEDVARTAGRKRRGRDEGGRAREHGGGGSQEREGW